MFLPTGLNITVKYLFCLWIRTNKYVEWYCCCLCDHRFVPVFKNEKALPLDPQWYKGRPQY